MSMDVWSYCRKFHERYLIVQIEELIVITPDFLSQYFLKSRQFALVLLGLLLCFKTPLWATGERLLILARWPSQRCASNISAALLPPVCLDWPLGCSLCFTNWLFKGAWVFGTEHQGPGSRCRQFSLTQWFIVRKFKRCTKSSWGSLCRRVGQRSKLARKRTTC